MPCLTEQEALARRERRERARWWGIVAPIPFGELRGVVVASGALHEVETIFDGLRLAELCSEPIIDLPDLIPNFYRRRRIYQARARRDGAWIKRVREVIYSETGEFVRLT